MGAVYHWVTKINPTLVAAVSIASIAFVVGITKLADAIKSSKPEYSVSIQIDNKGTAKAFHIVDGKLVPLK